MKSVAFHNLGCKVNSYEMEVMQQIIQNSGYEIVQFTQKSDIYVVNTCTVTNIADRKSRQMLHRAKQMNPSAVVVAVGCYAQTGLEDLKKDLAVDIIIGNNHKTEIADILAEYFREHPDGPEPVEVKEADSEYAEDTHAAKEKTDGSRGKKLEVITDLSTPSAYEDAQVYAFSERTRADVKIQDGCNQFCSYCAIPLSRGRVRSRRPEAIIEEIRTLVSNGHKEIVFTGIHISSYGIDFDDEAWKDGKIAPSEHASLKDGTMMRDYHGMSKLMDLVEMIDRAEGLEGLERIRLGSLEPRIITEENVKRLIAIKRVCPHFHLSLQSGCDATLKRMNRHYTAAEYAEGVARLRRLYGEVGKSVAITTDVIVGFPGETEEEFESTRAYLEDLKLYEMHIFEYSRRKNTAADKLDNQQTPETKKKRSKVLLDMTAGHSKEYRETLKGKEVEVLFEEEKNGHILGYTEDYVRIAVPAESKKSSTEIAEAVLPAEMQPDRVIGKVMRVKVEGFISDDVLFGKLIMN